MCVHTYLSDKKDNIQKGPQGKIMVRIFGRGPFNTQQGNLLLQYSLEFFGKILANLKCKRHP